MQYYLNNIVISQAEGDKLKLKESIQNYFNTYSKINPDLSDIDEQKKLFNMIYNLSSSNGVFLLTGEPSVLQFELKQNYPNPFNPTTNIEFTIERESNVEMVIYDVLGRRIFEIVNEKLKKGIYKYIFDGINLSSGIYFCQINTESKCKVIKMMLLK